MPMTNYPNGFKYGINLRGIPLVQTHPGQVFWLGNSSVTGVNCRGGSDGNDGTFQGPFATLDYAVGRCVANRGDVIFVKPGHAETISSAAIAALDVAGVAVVGLGVGSNRPTFTFTAAAANIPITAANMSIQNMLFVANFANVASFFTATGTATPTDFTVENCEFRDTSSILNALTIITGVATTNCLDGLTFRANRISSLGTTAATTAIKTTVANKRISITDNFGNWAVLNDTACMFAAGTANQSDFEFARNRLNKPNTSSTGGSFISGSGTTWTGHCYDNYMWQLDNSTAIWIPTGTKLAFSQNFSPITGVADASGLINPAAV